MSKNISKVEREVFLNLSKYSEIIFDVGSRTDMVLHELCPHLTYHLFEPNPIFFSELSDKVKKINNNKKIYANCLALSSSTSKNVDYFINSQSLVPNKFAPQSEMLADFKIDTISLPDYLNMRDLNKIDFLKLDTEGLDYLILLNNIDLIDSMELPFVQFEYWYGVRKFNDLLTNYSLYLLNEPTLSSFTGEKEKYIFLDENLMNKIDSNWVHNGWGGNIFGINKNWLQKNPSFELNLGIL